MDKRPYDEPIKTVAKKIKEYEDDYLRFGILDFKGKPAQQFFSQRRDYRLPLEWIILEVFNNSADASLN